MSQWEK